MKKLLLFFAGTLLLPAQVNIPIEKYKLDNGIRVILSRDNAVPVAAVYVIYNIGARAEEKGRTGFAHLFEHMMFQGSANAPKGVHFRSISSAGGLLNGSTHPDYTDYFQTMPANKLPLALWLEADRMRSLAITSENLANQKEAVKEERRMRLDNQPYANAIIEKWPEMIFRNWQNQHSIIGSFEDLNAATVEDVSKFFKTYYAPNNAVLVVVGDINVQETKKTIETYFGTIPPQRQPKRPDLTEPSAKPVSDIHRDPLARVPAVIAGYPGPARRSPEYYAMVMLDVILTGGDSSRFQQELVKGKQSVLQYETNPGWPFQDSSDYKDPGFYSMFLVHKPDLTGKQVVRQAQEIIDVIAKNGVPAAELERARTFLRATRIKEIQPAMNRAQLLGKFEVLDGDPSLINSELERLAAVSSKQIQAFAAKYLTAGKRAVLEILPEQKPAAPASAASAKEEGSK